MRRSKTKPMVMSLPGSALILCIPLPRMTLEQYALETKQSLRSVQHQANEGKYTLVRGKYGKERQINMVAEFLKEFRDAQEALKETA